jgi:signal transduction histidine kinase
LEALRILLVEDSPPDVEKIRSMLLASEREISLVKVHTREAFEAELSQRPPHLILSDCTLPAFNSSVALGIAKKITPSVPFIFVTGKIDESVVDLLRQGASDLVLKSRLERLVPAVSRALSEAEQRRAVSMAEEQLRRSHNQLRALTARLQSVREEERARIAREVHDELGQGLTELKLDLAWISGKLLGAKGVHRKIKSMFVQIDATIQIVRRIGTELRPGVLDSLGLAAAIEWQAAEFQERTGIICETQIDVTEKLWEQHFSTACFRIFQETLTNVIRHAHATHLEIRLAQVDGRALNLTMKDNGQGITEDEIADTRSIGLIGMKERAAQFGGKVTFRGVPGIGTVVTLHMPLPVTEITAGECA